MKRLFMTVVATIALTCSLSAFAECTMNGQTYQTGDRVGPFTCTANGTWQR